MYKIPKYSKSTIKSVERVQGEPIEHKMERILNNGEPISDGAPEIYTDRKEGVIGGYDIRTDRWEVAADAMDTVQKNIQAKRDARAEKPKEAKVINMKNNGGAESTNGTSDL